ncbi:MAG: proline--tRNA ligase [Phycisphaerales bacterium]|nr:proline--tRNA ligase [Phycisphaerae bacterium]NNF43397.1 proline--tRNA ligase [Phycisphaerales bacterium]NNM25655.1 proline--tRNA ligase [Phycisphaerales bacterium]
MSSAAAKPRTAITPCREQNYPEWYQQVVRAADLAETSPVRGCMVIKPWGYSLWENMQRTLDGMFKATGHRNAYFPLFIPLSYLEREAEHVEGFAKECAVVTHHRLEAGPDGGLVPTGKLEEPLVVRPTSETIIGEMFAKWVESYRDLPLLINQWANVVRWELRTRMFLRTTEFLWQEGHTAHATREEAEAETMQMLRVYADFAENWMAMPVIPGLKSPAERFPGAVETYSIEAMMQDRKALQAGTSHFLGQNFSKASDIKFLDEEGQLIHAWTTSWGVSTRLVGGLVMTHSDDDGLVLPPKLAPAHVAIWPITHKADDPHAITTFCRSLAAELRAKTYHGRPVEVELDERDRRGGDKKWDWVKKGVPIRVEVGPRDMANNVVTVFRRDRPHNERASLPHAEFVGSVVATLDEMQDGMLARARAFRAEHTRSIDDADEFRAFFAAPKGDDGPTPIHGGFALSHWCGDAEMEAKINADLGVTIRCIPIDRLPEDDGPGTCPFTGKPSERRVVWAKAY